MKKFIFLLLFFCNSVFAASDFYQFSSQKEADHFYELTSNLRCLVCQNQNLAESNAGLANDLRNDIYRKVNEGATDQEIINYLVARYGSFILYKPPVNKATLILWLAPSFFLLIGLSYLFLYLRKPSISKLT